MTAWANAIQVKGVNHARTLLVVEDEPDDIVFLQWAVQKVGIMSGLEVVPDEDAALRYLQAACAQLSSDSPRLPGMILLSLGNPEREAFRVLRWLREHPRCTTIPVVIWSDSEFEADIEEAYRLGANVYLVKPFKLAELEQMLIGLYRLFGFTRDERAPRR